MGSEGRLGPLRRSDAVALLGVVAVLQGEVAAGLVDERLERRLRERLDVGEDDLTAVLGELNRGLRQVLGE